MKWDVAIEAMCGVLVADSALNGAGSLPSGASLGSNVYMTGERTFDVPSIEWDLIDDSEGEIFERALFQWSLWAYSAEDLVFMERRLRALLVDDFYQALGFSPGFDAGFTAALQIDISYAGGRSLDGPRDGVLGRAFDTEIEVVRAIWAQT